MRPWLVVVSNSSQYIDHAETSCSGNVGKSRTPDTDSISSEPLGSMSMEEFHSCCQIAKVDVLILGQKHFIQYILAWLVRRAYSLKGIHIKSHRTRKTKPRILYTSVCTMTAINYD